MTSLLSAKKRAEEFAAAVDGRGQQSALRPELRQLVDVVGALRTTADSTPRPEFSASLRERLMTEAATALVPGAPLALPARRHGTRERRLAVAASAFVLVGGTAGMAAAAQNALPGDPLYPLKRGLERAQADLSTSSASKGADLLSQAGGRLAEAEALWTERQDADAFADSIDAFSAQAVEGSALILDSFDESRDPALVESVRTFAAESLATLQEIARTAPATAQDELALAATRLQEIDRRATEACSTCAAELPVLQLPASFLTASEVAAALDRAGQAVLRNNHPVITTPVPAPEAGTPTTDEVPDVEGPVGEVPLPDDIAVDGPGSDEGDSVTDPVTKPVEETVDAVKKGTGSVLPDDLDDVVGSVLP